MIIRHASLADIDTILAWRRERAAWLAAHGYDQWRVPWPRNEVAGAVQSGQCWMVWDGPLPVATLMLTVWIDTEGLWKLPEDHGSLWRAEDDPSNALYISKLIVPRAYAGGGLGGELLDWAAGRAYDAGLTWLRLDAWSSNTDLHAYYLRQGFAHVRTVPTRVSGWCAQRPAQPYTGTLIKTED